MFLGDGGAFYNNTVMIRNTRRDRKHSNTRHFVGPFQKLDKNVRFLNAIENPEKTPVFACFLLYSRHLINGPSVTGIIQLTDF